MANVDVVGKAAGLVQYLQAHEAGQLKIAPYGKPLLNQIMTQAVNLHASAGNLMDVLNELMSGKPQTIELHVEAKNALNLVMKPAVVIQQLLGQAVNFGFNSDFLAQVNGYARAIEADYNVLQGQVQANVKTEGEKTAGLVLGLLKVAGEFDLGGDFAAGDLVSGLIKSAKKAKEKDKGQFAIKPNHPKNKSGKGHYPLDTEGRGRNALARVRQYGGKVPSWWSGTLEELVKTIARAVKRRYPGIQISKKVKKD